MSPDSAYFISLLRARLARLVIVWVDGGQRRDLFFVQLCGIVVGLYWFEDIDGTDSSNDAVFILSASYSLE